MKLVAFNVKIVFGIYIEVHNRASKVQNAVVDNFVLKFEYNFQNFLRKAPTAPSCCRNAVIQKSFPLIYVTHPTFLFLRIKHSTPLKLDWSGVEEKERGVRVE